MARADNVKTLPTTSDRNKSDEAEQVPHEALNALEQRLSERTAELKAEIAERKQIEDSHHAVVVQVGR